MRVTRVLLSLACVALAVSVSACASLEPPQSAPSSPANESAPSATPEPTAEAKFDFAGTVWHSKEVNSAKACENSVTFVGDGTFDYSTRCADDSDWRSYSGIDDDSTWEFVDGIMTLSYKDGYNVCTGPASPELLDLRCSNKQGDKFDRDFLPSADL
jgi:hypothetical protein